MIAVTDYDAGNIRSVVNAFASLGAEVCVTSDPEKIKSAERVVLPGVGDFGDAAGKLREYGLEDTILQLADSDKPFLAICVGLQLLFEESEESPGAKGLSVLKGRIKRIPAAGGLKVPQIGWNSLDIKEGSRLFKGIDNGSFVYFVHSYYLAAEDEDIVSATTEYGVKIHAAVERGNLFATQFHPEKSSSTGLRILRNFMEL
ncbi:MAG: imidazole glycerol phosphate synthase subunit HisH [Lachnospiraceae bacterium]|nr:imidazole glycerol phosphate synthase subunit HisH [Lachnospiraceae bacterium]